jgi:guanosine-3',5'-bis(diphosphate) 3'-pyrophosphohydrolase
MKDIVIDLEAEKNEILKRYRALLRASKSTLQKGDKRMIRKAFDMALESHKDMRRKSGEPYIYHPIAVAQIAAEEIGLGYYINCVRPFTRCGRGYRCYFR